MKKISIIILSGLFVLSFCNTISSAEAQTNMWNYEAVDCPVYVDQIRHQAMVIDLDGKPIVVTGGDHLYLFRYDGSDWNRSILAELPDSYMSFMDIDSAGKLHILSYNIWKYELIYMKETDSGFSSELVIHKPYLLPAGLVVDENDNPHIIVEDRAEDTLLYLNKVNTAWNSSSWSHHPNYFEFKLFDIDDTGKLHITSIFQDTSGDHLEYITCGSSGWNNEAIDTHEYIDQVSLAIDASQQPVIIYNASNGDPV